MLKDLYAVILAGGSGSKLWPKSRELYPKQFLKLNQQSSTFFQQTFLNLVETVDDKNIVSITNIKHEPDIRIQLEEIQARFFRESEYKVLTEPTGRETAPAIALGIKYITSISSRKVDPIIIVIPSDVLITEEETFSEIINKGVELAKNNYIVTFGVKPTKADTGYSFIKTSRDKAIGKIEPSAYRAIEFKDNAKGRTIRDYVKSGNHYWNSGILMFKASVMLAELEMYAQGITDILKEIELSEGKPSVPVQIFDRMPEISIERAILENSNRMAFLPLEECGWSDLGSWSAIYEASEKDTNENVIIGKVIDIESQNSFIYSNSKLVATVGLRDTVVVETEDAILVCNKAKTQDVKKVYNELKKRDDDLHKVHKTVYRPWGYYTVMQEGEGFLTKCIVVNPGAKLSLQLHKHRSEHWVVLEGKALVVKGTRQYEMTPGDSIDISIGELHSLQNPYDKTLKVLEVQRGLVLDENDIVRVQDIYGRV